MSEDIAVLGFEVETSQMKQARDEMGRFEAQAKRVETSTERMESMAKRAFAAMGAGASALLRQVNSMTKAWALYEVATAAVTGSVGKLSLALATNGKELTKQEEGINKSTKALGLFKAALAALGISLGVSQLIQYTDTYGSLRGQIALTAESTREMNKTWRDLYTVSQQTAQSLKGTVELYGRMARSSKELGLTQTELVAITDTINKTLLISRTPAASAEAALFQLSQAMASGVLRGEELNSVMEQAPRLALALANGLGVPIGELRKMGAEGELTAKRVIGALQQQKDFIDHEFSSVFISVSNAMARVDNVMIDLVGRADEAAGASAVFGKAIADVITRLESGEAINSSTKALEFLTIGLSLASKALIFFIDNLEVFIGLWAGGKIVGAIFSVVSALNAFSVGSKAAAAASTALGMTLGTTSKAMAGFGAAIALTNPLTALIGLVSAAAAIYLLFATNATKAQDAQTAFNETVMNTGKNAQEYLGYLKELNQTKKEALTIDLTSKLEKEREVMAGIASDIRSELGATHQLSATAYRTGMLTDADKAAMSRLKAINDEMAKMQNGDIGADKMVERLMKIAEGAGLSKKELEDLRGRVVVLADQMQNSAGNAENYRARITLIKDPTNAAAQATIGLINSMATGGDALAAQSEEWAKYIGKLVSARDTIGMTKAEEVAYEAARKGFTADRVAYAVALAKQVEGLGKYEKALQANDQAEAEAAKTSVMRLAEIEASAVRGMVIAEEMAKLGELVAKGILTQIEAARMATQAGEQAYGASLEEARKRLETVLATIGKNTTPGKDAANEMQKRADALKQFVNEQEAAIKGAQQMAAAYAKGGDAVRKATQQIQIEKEVLKLGADARAKVVDLIQRENDARDKQDVAQATAALRLETEEQNAYADAILKGKDALVAYNVEKEVSAMLAGKNAAAVAKEVEEYRKAAQANQAAHKRVEDAQALASLIDQTANAQEKYNKRVAELERLAASAKTPQQAEAVRRAIEQAKKELIEAQNQLDPMAQKFASIASEIEDGFKESFASAFEEGEGAFKKMTDGMKSMFKRLLAELAYQAAVKPILMPILQGVGGAMGLPSGNVSQILQSVLGNVTGGTAGVGGGSANTGGGIMSSLGSLFSAFSNRNSGMGGGGGLGSLIASITGSGSSNGGGGGGLGSLLSTGSNLQNLWNLGKGFMGSVGSGVSGIYNGVVGAFGGNSIGSGISQVGGILSGTSGIQGPTMAAGGNLSGGMFSGAGSISNLAYMGYGVAGNFIGDWVGGGKYSGMLGSGGAVLGAAAGASSAAMGASLGAFAGPVGALAGAVIGGLVGSLFGSSKKLKEEGIDVNLAGDEMTGGRQYQVWVKKKLFGKKKKSYKYFDLPAGFQDDVNEQLGLVGDYIDSVGDMAGFSLTDRYKGVRANYHGSSSGFAAYMDSYVDKLLNAAAPNLDGFKQKDETTREAYGRLEEILKNYNSIKGEGMTDIAKQVESLDAAMAQARTAFEALAAPAWKLAEIEETRAKYLAKLADEMELAAQQMQGLTLAQQRDLDLKKQAEQAAKTRSDAELVGADKAVIEAGLAAQRQAIIDQFNQRQRSINSAMYARELAVDGNGRQASIVKLREQQQQELDAAKAAGYDSAQMDRLTALLAKEFQAAMKEMADALKAGNLDINARYAQATGNAKLIQAAGLASFDFKAVQDLKAAKEAGLDVLKLEQAIALERKKLVEDYANSIRDANAQNRGAIINAKGTIAERNAFALSEFDVGAARQLKEAQLAGLDTNLVKQVLQIQREQLIKEGKESIRAIDTGLRQRELGLSGQGRTAQVEMLREQQRVEMEAAKSAGYSAEQLKRLAAILQGEFAEAIKEMNKAVTAGNLDIRQRLAQAGGVASEIQSAALASFDFKAKQDLEDARKAGLDVLSLEKAIALERQKLVTEYAQSIRDANASNRGQIINSTGTLSQRLAFNLGEFDVQAGRQLEEAKKAGLNMELVRQVLALQRDAMIKETQEAIRSIDHGLGIRELNLAGKPFEAQRKQLEEQQRLEMEAAKAAGYTAAQLARLAAVLKGEMADAIDQMRRQTEAKNLDIQTRLAKLQGRELDALLMAFDDRARQELEDAKKIGADIVTLEKVLGLERLEVIEEFNKQALEQQKALAANYRDWLDSQLLGGTSTLTPAERLAEAQRQFEEQLGKARGGDKDAQGSITQYADQLLQIGRDFYASSDKYTQMSEFVRKTIENLGKQLNLPGFANGTRSAPRGLAWTGENGPELVDFSGGEVVYTSQQSAAMVGNAAVDLQPVVKAVVVTGAEQTQALNQLVELVTEQAQELANLRREVRRLADKPK